MSVARPPSPFEREVLGLLIDHTIQEVADTMRQLLFEVFGDVATTRSITT